MPNKSHICLFFMVALAILLSVGCRKENAFDCFKSNGKTITVERSVPDFTSLEVYDKIDLTIEKGASPKVEITAGGNIINNITSRVVNNVLILENKNTCNFVRGYKRLISIRVTVPNIRLVTNNGVGPVIFSEDFTQDTLRVRAENSGDVFINGYYGVVISSSHGNGDIYLKGAAKQLHVYSNGTNYTRAENFPVSDYIYLSTYSVGDALLNCENLQTLEYYIWKEGNIYCKGTAKSITKLGGDGKGSLLNLE